MSFTNKKKIKDFWNGKKSVLAGQKDLKLKYKEQKEVNKRIFKKNDILELGCGTGNLLEYLENKKKIRTAVGVDFSKKMENYNKIIN